MFSYILWQGHQIIYCVCFRCFVDMRNKVAPIINILFSVLMVIVFVVSIISYAAIWIKVKQTYNLLKKATKDSMPERHDKRGQTTAKTMTLFVFAFLVQWAPWLFYSIWSFRVLPPIWLLVWVVISFNLGGMYNALAYTIMRKVYQKKKKYRETANYSTTFSISGLVSTITVHLLIHAKSITWLDHVTRSRDHISHETERKNQRVEAMADLTVVHNGHYYSKLFV